MKKPKLEKDEKLSFNKIEILIIVVLVAFIVVSGITVVSVSTRNRRVANFKEDADYILSAAKNAYNTFKITDKVEYIATGSDGTTKGLCITVKGLQENEFLPDKFKEYEGYVVVEEGPNNHFNYTLWVTNKKYVIDGYDSTKIKDLSIKKGIEKYNNDEFSSKVKTSFTGTTKDKGGTGADKDNLKRYEATCINEKIE